MQVHNVSVIGSGQMGNGIAHVFALAGFDVVLLDVDQDLIDTALATIEKNLKRQAAKGAIDDKAAADAINRIVGSTDAQNGALADLVIEAVPEILELKLKIFRQYDGACAPDTTSPFPYSGLSPPSAAGTPYLPRPPYWSGACSRLSPAPTCGPSTWGRA